MKSVIKDLGNDMLEFEISKRYWERYEEARNHFFRTGRMSSTGLKETGTLALLWEEFDARLSAGTIADDTDWEEDDDDL